MKKIYLAGPEVFLPNSIEVLEKAKLVCKEFGFIGLSPFDGIVTTETGLNRANKIFLENCKLIHECDILIANCNHFRGALVDDGTSFEIGYAYSLKKIIFGYIDKKITLPEIVEKNIPTSKHESGYRIDNQGFLLNEDFGNSINLMIEYSIVHSGGKLIEGKFRDVLSNMKDFNF